MANLIYYRNHFGGYQSSEEILAAIDEIAADDLPQDGAAEEELRDSDAHRIWEGPTADEQARVIARAWELAPAEQDKLFWGCTTIQRPDAAV